MARPRKYVGPVHPKVAWDRACGSLRLSTRTCNAPLAWGCCLLRRRIGFAPLRTVTLPRPESAILSPMPDRRRSWKTDSQWLRLALTATGLGVSLILASAAAWKSSRVIYVGAALALVGAYIACAVLVLPLPLPTLLSERRNRAFRRRVGAFLVEGHELRARPVANGAELASLEAAYRDWSARGQVWLDENARPADAAASSTRSVPRRRSSIPLTAPTTTCA